MRIPLIVVGVVTLAASSVSAQTVDRSEVAAMVGWINQARAERGAVPLVEDPRLDAVSEAHSMDMATHSFFNHVSPTTGAPDQRAHRAGIPFIAWAENIALNQSPRAAMDSLLQSPGHYQNITNTGVRAVGIGIVRTSQGVYVTQSFAAFDPSAPAYRQPATPVAPIVPATPATPAVAAPQRPVVNSAPASSVDDCDIDPQTGDCAACQGDGCDRDADDTTAPANTEGTTLPGITGLGLPQLPNLGQMPSIPSIPSVASVPQGTPIQVRPAPRDAQGNPNWDVQTPLGSFRVSVPGEGGASSPIASLLNQLMGSARPTPAAPTARPAAPAAARPTDRPEHSAHPGRVVEVELPPVAAPAQGHRRARRTNAPVAVAPIAETPAAERWSGDF